MADDLAETAMVQHNRVCSLVAVLAVASGCVAVGLARTPLDRWVARDFGDIGLRVTLPRKALLVGTLGGRGPGTDETKWCTLRFFLHSLRPGRFLTEPTYLVQFRFERLSASQYDAFRMGVLPLSYYWVWKDHHALDYATTRTFAWRDMGREALGWRRDYHCGNGDVVVAGVVYLLLEENAGFRTEDTAAVERVLDSLAPLGP